VETTLVFVKLTCHHHLLKACQPLHLQNYIPLRTLYLVTPGPAAGKRERWQNIALHTS